MHNPRHCELLVQEKSRHQSGSGMPCDSTLLQCMYLGPRHLWQIACRSQGTSDELAHFRQPEIAPCIHRQFCLRLGSHSVSRNCGGAAADP